ncbi:MAG: hypothetical protein LLG37_05880 [Spirochaetia bacterium]|nr:hypothetical protein [Spirochaetia bacterium]
MVAEVKSPKRDRRGRGYKVGLLIRVVLKSAVVSATFMVAEVKSPQRDRSLLIRVVLKSAVVSATFMVAEVKSPQRDRRGRGYNGGLLQV